LDKIWDDFAAFEEAANIATAAANDLVSALESGDKAGIGAKMKALGKSCGACHNKFRKKQK
jgi:cytochrome c556